MARTIAITQKGGVGKLALRKPGCVPRDRVWWIQPRPTPPAASKDSRGPRSTIFWSKGIRSAQHGGTEGSELPFPLRFFPRHRSGRSEIRARRVENRESKLAILRPALSAFNYIIIELPALARTDHAQRAPPRTASSSPIQCEYTRWRACQAPQGLVQQNFDEAGESTASASRCTTRVLDLCRQVAKEHEVV